MQKFYKRALLALIFLIAADSLVAALLVSQSYLSIPLLGARQGGASWRYAGSTDSSRGGASSVHIEEPDGEHLRYTFKLTETGEYPFVGADLLLYDGKGELVQVDWSKYRSVT